MIKRSIKLIICIIAVIVLFLETSSVVLASLESHAKDTRAVFGIEQVHDSKHLDGTNYATIGYRVDGKNVYRIYYDNGGQRDWDNTLVCLDKDARFPATEDASGRINKGKYTSLGEATQSTLSSVKRSIDAQGAKRIDWLINNALLPEDSDELQKQKIAEAFDAIISSTANDVNPVKVEDIRGVLTKDDLVIALQLAVWQITNDVVSGNIQGTFDGISFDSLTGNSIFSDRGIKGTYLKYLYNYYVAHWDDETTTGGTNPVVSKPETNNTVQTAQALGVYIYVGPFKIDEATNYYSVDVSFKDNENNTLNNVSYILTDKNDGRGHVLAPNKESLNGKEFYVRIRALSSARSVTVTATPKIQLSSSKGYVWKGDEVGDQPVLSFVRTETSPNHSQKTIRLNPVQRTRQFDASLRKSIYGFYKYDNFYDAYRLVPLSESDSREPTVRIPLSKDADYNEYAYVHRKDPYKTEVGAEIIYKIQVYNEGEEDIYITSITDNLPPSGIRMPNQSTEPQSYALNSRYGWTYDSSTNSVTTHYDSNLLLHKTTSGSLNLDSRFVYLALVVTPEAKGKIVTNIAEITGYATVPSGGKDIDSGYSTDNDEGKRAVLPTTEYDWQMYAGYANTNVYGNYNVWFKGQEDDDDFEKIEVPGDKEIDLALRKSIYEVSGKSHSRAVTPNTDPLDDGATTSTFSDRKDPITVKVGDKVKYRIRVFNEGEQNGYASKIEDYLPKGLRISSTIHSKY